MTETWTTTQDSAQARSLIPGARLLTAFSAVVGSIVVLGAVGYVALAGVPWVSPQSGVSATSPPVGGERSTTATPASASATDTAAPSPTAGAAAPANADWVRVTLEFGEQGSEPGQFTDPRQIAVDPEGNIFVADYRTLRVQRFDPVGKFVKLFQLRRGTQSEFIAGLAADHQGHIWVSRGGDLLKLVAKTGRLVSAKMHRAPKLSYGAIAAHPGGAVYVQNFGATSSQSSASPAQTDSLRKLSSTGRLLRRWKKDVASGPVALDSQGNVYVADAKERRIDVIDESGEVARRLGGREQKQWSPGFISSLAVDGDGRLLVLAGDIHVLDPAGKPLGRFDSKGARAIALDGDGALYTVTSYCRVIKYELRIDASARATP